MTSWPQRKSWSNPASRAADLDRWQETLRPASQPMRRRTGKILALLIASAACLFAQAAERGRPAAIVEGEAISEETVSDQAGPQLRQLANQEYEIKSRVLESMINQKLLQLEAKRRGLDPEALLKAEADSKAAEPTESEVEAFYLGQSDRINRPFAEVKAQLRQALQQLRVQQARQRYQASLRENASVTILLRPPKLDVSYDVARLRGDKARPVTIVEFSDFQCPYCRNVGETLKQLLAKYGDKVSLAFRDFPLRTLHPQAQAAAEAARCAAEQGKFWEYHDLLFQNQGSLGPDSYPRFAETVKLDVAQFRACVSAGKYRPQIEDDIRDGTRLGVSGTPAFFVNGVFLNGAVPAAAFEKIIDQELAGQGTANPAPPQASVNTK